MPTGVWHDVCDVSRSQPITVGAENSSGVSHCPGGMRGSVAAFGVSGHTPEALLCVLKNGSYWLRADAGDVAAVGSPNTTTCASISWAVPPGTPSSSSWCRLPRSAACPTCLSPPPAPSPGPTPAPPQPTPPHTPPPAKTPTVLAFYMGDVGAPTYWIDYDWSILTHVVMYGWNDPNMISYAKARNVKLMQTYNGCIDKDLTNKTVRDQVIADAVSLAPVPYGKRPVNTSVDGLFFDIECTEQPCPWLEPERAAGQALFFRDLKAAWPTVLLSLYVSGNPDVRITGPPANSANRAYPFGYSAAQVQAFAPYLDQVVYGGYASVRIDSTHPRTARARRDREKQRAALGERVSNEILDLARSDSKSDLLVCGWCCMKLNYTFLRSNTEVNCGIDPVCTTTLLPLLYPNLDATDRVLLPSCAWNNNLSEPVVCVFVARISGGSTRRQHLWQRQPKRNCKLRSARHRRVWSMPNGTWASASTFMLLTQLERRDRQGQASVCRWLVQCAT